MGFPPVRGMLIAVLLLLVISLSGEVMECTTREMTECTIREMTERTTLQSDPVSFVSELEFRRCACQIFFVTLSKIPNIKGSVNGRHHECMVNRIVCLLEDQEADRPVPSSTLEHRSTWSIGSGCRWPLATSNLVQGMTYDTSPQI